MNWHPLIEIMIITVSQAAYAFGFFWFGYKIGQRITRKAEKEIEKIHEKDHP